ncbi:hypothetical protein PMZ73_17230 [[Clostridium] symbiosum]|uniref:Lipoprotein n=1 Tax=Clostridium symbiosum TaxID=1512 RepID=A0AAW6AXX1_CLOSY|nr:hypothetical protein [[Clostridium] symbiosum]MDB1979127.1 hypothetical protein [[Clostridium] symbiosum]MDB1983883.1 hypothetical protein [[Clostridium] symbiosum]MDB1988260.1 hypothetical protein [[Clostridium] symbiosum]MDB1992880.1 hypothetical protein [[Clostridium] symbiosum]MDB1997127.1 hypothetical protein [[Clostridium] symbiosum]
MKKRVLLIAGCLSFALCASACSDSKETAITQVVTEATSKQTVETENATEYSTRAVGPVSNTFPTKPINDTSKTGTLDYILFPDTMRWNMAPAEVKDTETRNLDSKYTFESKNPAFLNYKLDKATDKYFDSASIVYCFPDNKLQARWCSFDSNKILDYRDMYNEIKNVVSSKYGECESENIVWTDTTYQQDDSKWNDAFRYGYVTIETTWHTSDTAVIITWDYNNDMTVAVSTLDFEGQL